RPDEPALRHAAKRDRPDAVDLFLHQVIARRRHTMTYKCKFEWPNGAHIAVVFNMSWETWEKTLGTSKNNQKVSERVPADAHYTRGMRWIFEHAHGENGGMQRLLDVWKRHDIRTSAYADGHTVTLFPELAKEAAADGHEFIIQGWEHNYLWAMSLAEQI